MESLIGLSGFVRNALHLFYQFSTHGCVGCSRGVRWAVGYLPWIGSKTVSRREQVQDVGLMLRIGSRPILQNEAQDAQTHWSITPFISVVPKTSDYFALRVHDGTGRIALVDRLCGVLASTPPRSLLVASPSELLGPAGVKIIRANDGHQ